MKIGGITLNETERQVKRLIEQFLSQDDTQLIRAARAIFGHEQANIRFTWKELVMGERV